MPPLPQGPSGSEMGRPTGPLTSKCAAEHSGIRSGWGAGCLQRRAGDKFSFLPSRPQRRRPATVSVCALPFGGSFPLTSPARLTHCPAQRPRRLLAVFRNSACSSSEGARRALLGKDSDPLLHPPPPPSPSLPPSDSLISPSCRVCSPCLSVSPLAFGDLGGSSFLSSLPLSKAVCGDQ